MCCFNKVNLSAILLVHKPIINTSVLRSLRRNFYYTLLGESTATIWVVAHVLPSHLCPWLKNNNLSLRLKNVIFSIYFLPYPI